MANTSFYLLHAKTIDHNFMFGCPEKNRPSSLGPLSEGVHGEAATSCEGICWWGYDGQRPLLLPLVRKQCLINVKFAFFVFNHKAKWNDFDIIQSVYLKPMIMKLFTSSTTSNDININLLKDYTKQYNKFTSFYSYLTQISKLLTPV